ncbi:MAG: fused response regulator/phosphatase [Victivallaceae bacterium]
MESSTEKYRVMIVDDTVENLNLLQAVLTRNGYLTAVFPRAELALQALENNLPDLILLDINMPGMSGLELCQKLKAEDKYKEIPVIFLSAMTEISDKVEAFHSGGIDYITKPFNFDEVLIRVQTHIKVRRQQQELERQYQLLKEIERKLEAGTLELQATNRALNLSLDALKRDEEAGRIVQFKLLPETPAVLSGLKLSHFLAPSMYMSGDFVDYFELDDEHTIFYIADVSGHGSASAFITFLLKSFITDSKDNYFKNNDRAIIDPAEMLSRLNKNLIDVKLGMFIAMFYGVFKKTENVMIFANGGQFPFPLFYDGHKTEAIVQKSSPVGLFECSQYANMEMPVPEGFMLTLFSDGILETLPTSDVAEQLKILEAITSECGHNLDHLIKCFKLDGQLTLQDDIAILTIQREKCHA